MVFKTPKQVADLRRVQIQDTAVARALQGSGGVFDQLQDLNANMRQMLVAQSTAQAVPTANLLYNGELGHSNFTWIEVTGTPSGDKNAECSFWYSHNKPASSHTFIDSNVNTGADTITLSSHEFTTGCTVDFTLTGGALPAPIVISTTYFVIYVDANTIKLATTVALAEAGTAINITTQGTAAETFTIQQQLLSTTAYTSATNNELKTMAHSTFDPRYSKWDSSTGQGDLTGTTSIDALMPSNNVDATTTLARVSMIAARKNSFIEFATDTLMAAGIWDNTSGQRKFLEGSIDLKGSLLGATGTKQRRFKVLLTSDRGYQILSNEVILPATPANLSSSNYIGLSWGQQAGQLQVEIYEHYDPGGAGDEYRLVTQVSSATSFIYEGGYLVTVSGYPTPTGSNRNATYVTQTGDMENLVVNGSAWDTINFPINVPSNYNKGLTTNRQWVRLWLTVAPNLFIEGVTTNNTTSVTIPVGAVNSAAYASGGYGSGGTSLYVGLVAQVYDEDDVLLSTTTVTSVTSDTAIVLGASIATGTNRKVRIVAGGFHGVLIDKIHLGYQQNTSYAPNANDNRTLQPIAAPDGSSQGGVGGGGGGGGIGPGCVVGSTPIELINGEWQRIDQSWEGRAWAGPGLECNALLHLRQTKQKVRQVRTANGCEVVCTDTESFVTSMEDTKRGTFLYKLREGDEVLTKIDGRMEASKIVTIGPYLGEAMVYTPTLSSTRMFIAGRVNRPWWQRKTVGGFVLHNNKPPLEA